MMIQLDALASNQIRHAFFTREGGVSAGVYASLNCGYTGGDASASVSENRARAMRALGLAPESLVTAKQVHGAEALIVEAPWEAASPPKADALATRVPGITLGILSADCVPVLLLDAEAGVIGAAHAGWRGALSGVVEAAVGAMEELGAQVARMSCAIGPAIAQASYEVGPEFPRQFLAHDPGNAVFFVPAPKPGHFLFDLKGYVARRLKALYIERIEISPADTATDPARFFSYRRSCLTGALGHGLGLSAIALAP